MNKLKQLREEAGLSQEELSLKSGVSRVTISMLETGSQTNTTANTLIKLANALDKKVADFF
jgi:transcriptional regulator with XRE-family HTH domain